MVTWREAIERTAEQLQQNIEFIEGVMLVVWPHMATWQRENEAEQRLLAQRDGMLFTRKYAPWTPDACCEACYVIDRDSQVPAAVVVSALWASGSLDGQPMPLCWNHFEAWRKKLEPIMARILQADKPGIHQ